MADQKLHEELFYKDEPLTDTDHDKILLASSRNLEWKVVEPIIERMARAVEEFDEKELVKLLNHLVPEFSSVKNKEQTRNNKREIIGSSLTG